MGVFRVVCILAFVFHVFFVLCSLGVLFCILHVVLRPSIYFLCIWGLVCISRVQYVFSRIFFWGGGLVLYFACNLLASIYVLCFWGDFICSAASLLILVMVYIYEGKTKGKA